MSATRRTVLGVLLGLIAVGPGFAASSPTVSAKYLVLQSSALGNGYTYGSISILDQALWARHGIAPGVAKEIKALLHDDGLVSAYGSLLETNSTSVYGVSHGTIVAISMAFVFRTSKEAGRLTLWNGCFQGGHPDTTGVTLGDRSNVCSERTSFDTVVGTFPITLYEVSWRDGSVVALVDAVGVFDFSEHDVVALAKKQERIIALARQLDSSAPGPAPKPGSSTNPLVA